MARIRPFVPEASGFVRACGRRGYQKGESGLSTRWANRPKVCQDRTKKTFLSWNRPRRDGQVPDVSTRKLGLVTAVIHGELLAIVRILLCAAIMARGGWV